MSEWKSEGRTFINIGTTGALWIDTAEIEAVHSVRDASGTGASVHLRSGRSYTTRKTAREVLDLITGKGDS